MAWPHVSRVLKEIPQHHRIGRQKSRESLGTFARVTALARSDQVATRPVAVSYTWLYVVDRQLHSIKDIAAVDTSVAVTGQYILALHLAGPDIRLGVKWQCQKWQKVDPT